MDNFQDWLVQLIDRAQKKKFSEFQIIRNWAEYKAAREIRQALTAVTNCLEKSLRKVLKGYCKDIVKGTAKVDTILAYNILKDTYKFYQKELETINYTIWEYEAYLLAGNYLNAFFGAERTDDDLQDHRGLWP